MSSALVRVERSMQIPTDEELATLPILELRKRMVDAMLDLGVPRSRRELEAFIPTQDSNLRRRAWWVITRDEVVRLQKRPPHA